MKLRQSAAHSSLLIALVTLFIRGSNGAVTIFSGRERSFQIESMRCRGRLSRSFALQPGSTLKLSYSKTRCLCAKTAGFILTAKQTTTLDYHLSVCFSYFDLIPNEKLIVKLRGRNVFTLRGQEESFCYNSTDARGDLELRLKVKKLCPYDGIANAAAGFRLTVRSIEASCNNPSFPLNGGFENASFASIASFAVGAKVSYKCDTGHRMIGNRVLTCLPSKSWSSDLPRCAASDEICLPVSKVLANGHVNSSTTRGVGSVIRLVCDDGFGLRGLPSYRCLSNGQWQNKDLLDRAECVANLQTCPDLFAVPHTTVIGRELSFHAGTYVKHCCAPGARIVGEVTPGGHQFNCTGRWCESNGIWSDIPPRCEADQTLFQRLYTDLLSSTGKSLHEDGDNESAEEEPLECVRVVDNNSSHFTSDETPTPTTTSPAGEEIGRTGQQQNQTQGLRYLPGCSRTGRVLRDVSGCFDLAFLLDGSGSITREQFRDLELEFVRNVTNFFRLGKEKTHVSILIFTDNTRWVLRDEHDDRVLHRTLDNLTQPTRGDTNLRRALARFIQRVALPLHNGSLAYRESCRKVMFILSDGDLNKGGSPVELANTLKGELNWEIYAIGIANDRLKKDNLRDLASKYVKDHVFVIGERDKDKKYEQVFPIQLPKADFTRCGRPSGALDAPINRRARILGGVSARFGRYPWQVAIKRKGTNQVFCGGAMICENGCRWVLTAAHCIRYWVPFNATHGREEIIPISEVSIRFGETDLSVREGSEITCNVKTVRFEHSYNPKYYENDIALFEPDCRVELSAQRRCICLPKAADEELAHPGKPVEIAGWGVTGGTILNPQLNPVLQWLQMNVVSKEECDRVGSPIGDGTFCAGTTDGRDSCRGDSGGPLVARRFDGSYTVIGIVSYSKWDPSAGRNELQCGRAGYYGVYTNVAHHKVWIKSQLNSPSPGPSCRD